MLQHRRARLARADRRVGAQAEADRAGKLTREEFMERHLRARDARWSACIKNGEIPDVVYATVPAPCPKCGGEVQENYRKFQCQKCDFSIWKVISGREWSPDEIAELITKRFIGPLTGFRSRMGKPFAAGDPPERRIAAWSSTSARARARARKPPTSAARSRSAPARNAARACSSTAWPTCEKAVGPERRPATSAPGADPAAADRARADEEAARRPGAPIC